MLDRYIYKGNPTEKSAPYGYIPTYRDIEMEPSDRVSIFLQDISESLIFI